MNERDVQRLATKIDKAKKSGVLKRGTPSKEGRLVRDYIIQKVGELLGADATPKEISELAIKLGVARSTAKVWWCAACGVPRVDEASKDDLAKEMLKRGMRHENPLNELDQLRRTKDVASEKDCETNPLRMDWDHLVSNSDRTTFIVGDISCQYVPAERTLMYYKITPEKAKALIESFLNLDKDNTPK